MEDIHAIRPPVEVGFNPGILITMAWILGIIFLLLLVLYTVKKWLKNRKKLKNKKDNQHLISPFEAAMEKINLLRKKGGVDLRLFYFDLTTILRDYIGRSFDFHAIEMTSQEFLKQINLINLDRHLIKGISQFQTQTDPFKYAGIVPQKDQVENDIIRIKKIIENVEAQRIKKKQKSQTEHQLKVQSNRIKGNLSTLKQIDQTPKQQGGSFTPKQVTKELE